MADKDALQALQSRLAERMQQVRDEPVGRSWLAVRCAGLGLLLPLRQAGEIFERGTLVPVPHTQPWFAGVVNHRGAICTVVDFARWLGLRPDDEPPRPGVHPRLVALNASLGVNAALQVDRLEGLRHEGELKPVPPDPAAPPRPGFAASVWADRDGRAWQEIDLGELARHGQFLGVAA